MITVGFNLDVRLPDPTPELAAALAEGRATLEISPIPPVSPDWQPGNEDVPVVLSVQTRVVQFLPANNSIPVTYICEES